MKNKILIELVVPDINEVYNIYIPVNKKIGNVINLIDKTILEILNGNYQVSEAHALYNQETGEKYQPNLLVRESSIKQGSTLILL